MTWIWVYSVIVHVFVDNVMTAPFVWSGFLGWWLRWIDIYNVHSGNNIRYSVRKGRTERG